MCWPGHPATPKHKSSGRQQDPEEYDMATLINGLALSARKAARAAEEATMREARLRAEAARRRHLEVHARFRADSARRLEQWALAERAVVRAEEEERRAESMQKRRAEAARWQALMETRAVEREKQSARSAERDQRRALAVLHDLHRRELVAARRTVAAVRYL